MKVKVITTILMDIPVYPPTIIDSDTVGDYKAELDYVLHNEALEHITTNVPYEEIEINSVEPYDEGVEDYGEILNNWKHEKS